MNKSHILIIEDEPKITKLISQYLAFEGFKSSCIHNGKNALKAYIQLSPDLVILDVNLPVVDGITICQSIRQLSDVPIIMLSAKVDEEDQLLGFEAGADDYVCKPFRPKALMARVKARLNRMPATFVHSELNSQLSDVSSDTEVIHSGNIMLDPSKHQVTVNNNDVKLTANEFILLKVLLNEPNKVFSRKDLLAFTQGKYFESYERTIDTHIKNIRRKLYQADDSYQPISSIYGIGYKYIASPENHSVVNFAESLAQVNCRQ